MASSFLYHKVSNGPNIGIPSNTASIYMAHLFIVCNRPSSFSEQVCHTMHVCQNCVTDDIKKKARMKEADTSVVLS